MTIAPIHDPETQNQNAYDDLLTAIEASEGQLSLLIAVCDDPQLREALITRYERDLAPAVKAYRLTLNKDEPSLRAAIFAAVQSDEYLKQGGRAVLTLTGTEQLSFLSQSDEPSEQDRFFGYLQWTREALRDFRFPIVIWVTYQILGHLSRKSPDFWSWRKGVFRFVSRKTITVPARELEPFRTFGPDLPKLDDDALLPLEDLKALLQNVEQQNPADPLLGTLYAQLGRIYARRLKTGEALDHPAELAQAVEYFERAIALQEKNEQFLDLATSLNNLAGLYYAMGRYSEAEPLYLRALSIVVSQLGQDHPTSRTVRKNFEKLVKLAVQAGRAGELSDHPMTQALIQQMQQGEGAD